MERRVVGTEASSVQSTAPSPKGPTHTIVERWAEKAMLHKQKVDLRALYSALERMRGKKGKRQAPPLSKTVEGRKTANAAQVSKLPAPRVLPVERARGLAHKTRAFSLTRSNTMARRA